METPLDRIEFLASSQHRVEILRALDSEPLNPRDLEQVTDASRSTVGRVIKELEDHGWIERGDAGYETTRLGSLVIEEFESLLETMNRVAVLESVVQWLSIEDMSIDLYELGDATIVYPSEHNLSSHIEHGNELLQDSERVLVFVNEMISVVLEAICDHVVRNSVSSAHVYGATIAETILKHEGMREEVQDIVEEGGSVYRYDGDVPFDMIILDHQVILYLCTEAYLPEGVFVSENEAVLSWAKSIFDEYRSDSTPFNIETAD